MRELPLFVPALDRRTQKELGGRASAAGARPWRGLATRGGRRAPVLLLWCCGHGDEEVELERRGPREREAAGERRAAREIDRRGRLGPGGIERREREEDGIEGDGIGQCSPWRRKGKARGRAGCVG